MHGSVSRRAGFGQKAPPYLESTRKASPVRGQRNDRYVTGSSPAPRPGWDFQADHEEDAEDLNLPHFPSTRQGA